MRFDHGHKRNRPAFLLCQALVTLAAVVPCRDRPRAVPIATGLCRRAGHAGKIALAKGLPRAVGDRFEYDGTPELMAAHARRLREHGVDVIGACCGSTPAHLAAMREALVV